MKLATAANKRRSSGFTLAEVLAALLFLAIVIPAAIEAMHVASLAGDVAARKGAAARVADRVLNESIVLTNWNGGGQNGVVTEGAIEYRWKLSQQNWTATDIQLLTAEVTFSAQGRDYGVRVSTLADAHVQTPSQTMNSQ
jgi:Tfp pilus assembly protein PilV